MVCFEAGKPVEEHCRLSVCRLFRSETVHQFEVLTMKYDMMLIKLYTENKKWMEIS
jgi:hypothetical protein